MFSTNQKLTHKLAKTKNLTSWLDFWLDFLLGIYTFIFVLAYLKDSNAAAHYVDSDIL